MHIEHLEHQKAFEMRMHPRNLSHMPLLRLKPLIETHLAGFGLKWKGNERGSMREKFRWGAS